ncbi:MAG: PD40 domain-containing protein, partial [Anaerolineales bacterium]|nr:PD40 domain-containing protein [Anaerolineales bacterium]
ELVRLPPAETPRGGRSWRGKLGWGVVFLLLLMLVRWMFGQTVAVASPALSQPPRVFAVPEVPLAQTTRVSVAADGTEGNGYSFTPAVSGDGNWVAFVSGATNLTGTPTDGTWQVHLKDLASGAVTLASVSTAGVPGDDNAGAPALSSDGRHVVFESYATNLISGTVNSWLNVFVHDTATLTTAQVSVASDGTPGNWNSENPALSADGRYIVFQSNASNLVPDDNYPYVEIFLHDRDADADGVFDEPGAILTRRVSQAANGTPANAVSTDPDISASGRWIVFTSAADNLVADDTNAADDVFLYDRDADEDNVFDEPGGVSVTLLSVGVGGALADDFSSHPVISADGRQVAFESLATNLIPAGTEPFSHHVFVRDWAAGTTALVSQSTTGAEANAWSQGAGLSADGRWIMFSSSADVLVPGDTNFSQDLFVRDRDVDEDGVLDEAGQVATARVSVNSNGGQMATGQAYGGAISGDGRRIVFDADAYDLVSGDNNFLLDVFLYDEVGGATSSADVALDDIPNVWVEGLSYTWDFSLQNLGPGLASNVVLDYVIMGANLVTHDLGSPSQGTCSNTEATCTLGDVPNGNEVDLSFYASVSPDDQLDDVYQGSVAVVLEATSSTFDPNPSNNVRTFVGNFYACSDRENGCPLDEIFCSLFVGIIPLENAGGFIPDLALYYHVRDGIMTSPTGQRYTDLYYTHSSEVTDLLFAEDALWDLALDGLAQWEPHLAALVAGDGDTAVITPSQIQVLDDFLNALSAAGSPALQQAIADERANLPPLETFVGMTMDEARGAVVGYGVYLPMVGR